MRRGLVIAALFAALAPLAQAAPASDALTLEEPALTPERAQEMLQRAVALAQSGDSAGVVATLRPLVEARQFGALPERERFAGTYLLGAALYDMEQWSEAHALVQRAASFSLATGEVWRLRFWTGVRAQDWSDAIDTMEALSRRWPERLGEVHEEAVSFLIQRARAMETPDAREYQLLAALRRAGWESSDPFVDMSYRWRTLTRLSIDRGELEEARAVAADVHAPAALIGMRIDRRFDAVAPAVAGAENFAAMLEAYLQQRRAIAAAHPDELGGLLDVVHLLVALDRNAEALAMLAPARARIEAGAAPYEDQAEWANWVYDYEARALMQLGRGDEALAALQRGANLGEDTGPNVSQSINYAHLLMRVGRYDEALAALDAVPEEFVSAYGWMNANLVRACALAEQGETEAANAVLEAMRARAADSRRVLTEAELCFGNVEQAAAVFIAALDDPRDREAALLDAQRTLPPTALSAFDRRMDAHFEAMLAREDVRAAVERYGRVLTVPLRRSGL